MSGLGLGLDLWRRPIGNAAVSGAALLASGYAQAFVLDFADAFHQSTTGFYGSAYSNDTGTPANNYDSSPDRAAASLLTYTAPSLKMTMGPSGLLRFGAHNLLTYSDDISNAAWIATNTTKTDFETLTLNAGTAAKHLYQNAFMTSGLEYEYSCEIKPDGHQYVQILNNGDAAAFANFDVLSGSVGTVGAKTTATITATDAGYYKCSVRWASSASLGTQNRIYGVTNLTSGFAAATSATGALKIRRAHLRRTPSDDTYMATTSAARYALPLEWDTAGNPLGLLVEEARTNLVTYSEQFDNAAWTKTELTVSANAATAPDGQTTADLLTPTATSSFHRAVNAAAAVATTSGILSAFVKPNGYSQVALRESASTGVSAVFSLVGAGSVDGTHSVGGHTATSAQITALANGWYRISFGYTLTGSSTTSVGVHVLDGTWTSGDPLSVSFSGDTVSGVYVWGAGHDVGAFLTSYIPTLGSTVTRAADSIKMPQANFPWNGGTGTLEIDGIVTTPTTSGTDLHIVPRSGQTHIETYLWVPS